MSLPPFYTLLNTTVIDAEQVHFTISIINDHPLFKGHFEEMPVVPGAMMVKIIKELFSSYLKKDLILVSAKDIKFTALIEPVEDLKLAIEIIHTPSPAHIAVKVLIKNLEVVCMKMTGLYKEVPL